MADFLMPSLGSDMESGVLVEWNVEPGDRVKRGDIVAAVETEKGIIDIEIFDGGEIEELLVEIGQVVAVGSPLARLVGEADAKLTPAVTPTIHTEPAVRAAELGDQLPPSADQTAAITSRKRISPIAKRRAGELGIDTEQVSGSGPKGAVTLDDIEQAAAPRRFDARAMRRAIGAAMARSKREIPHYYLGSTIDMEASLCQLTETNADRPPAKRMLYAVLLIKAVARALQDVRELNGYWREDAFEPGQGIHVGLAVALRGGGLVAPAIHDCDAKDLSVLMAEFRDLVQRARFGGLRSSEMTDATVTISSLGDQGVELIYPVIYPPQVAIVGFGGVVNRPWVVDDRIEARRIMTATLAADHRASDGHRGAAFLAAVNENLQHPEQL